MTMRPLTVFGPGKGEAQPARPVRHTRRDVVPKPGVPPQGASRQVDGVRSVPAAEVTRISLASRSIWMPSATLGPKRGRRFAAFENLGMLVADHEDARASCLLDLRPFGGMDSCPRPCSRR